MAGTPLQEFNDYVKSTGVVYLTGQDSIINEAVKNTYFLGRLLRGRSMSDILQNGKAIKEVLMFDDSSTYEEYLPNDTSTWHNPQVQEDTEVAWRFAKDHMTWTDQEVLLNAGGMDAQSRQAYYKNLKRSKMQRMWTSFMNGLENSVLANPGGESSQMEAAKGRKCMSIFALINEYHNGLHKGWTTVHGVDPTTVPDQDNGLSRWAPQIEGYKYDDVVDANAADSLFRAFDEMEAATQFIPPPMQGQYFEPGSRPNQFIMCSTLGRNYYKAALRLSNDVLVNKQDAAYNMPRFSGLDLVRVSTLDTAAIYRNTADTGYQSEAADGGVDQSGSGGTTHAKGPRYYFLNADYIKMYFHNLAYFQSTGPLRHPNQEETWINPVRVWRNLICCSRMRNGVVYPTEDVTA